MAMVEGEGAVNVPMPQPPSCMLGTPHACSISLRPPPSAKGVTLSHRRARLNAAIYDSLSKYVVRRLSAALRRQEEFFKKL